MSLSEDEIEIISPAMFREFALPTLVGMSGYFGGIVMHCCADSERQWENLKLIPNLRILNLNRSISSGRESWKVFNGHVALHPNPCGEGEDILLWPSQYPVGTHAVLTLYAKDREEAREKTMKIREIL